MRHLKPNSRPKSISFNTKRASKRVGPSPRAAMEIVEITMKRQFCNIPAAVLLAALFPGRRAEISRSRVTVRGGRSVESVEFLERRMLLTAHTFDVLNANGRG